MTTERRAIDGETRLMGVIGEGISYTLSPRLHNAAATQLGVNIAYLRLDTPAAAVPALLDAAWHLGAVGFNVTTPHKGLIAGLTPGDGRSSVNTLYRGANWWEAESTDGEGFANGLMRLGRAFDSFTELVVIGAGGAVRAILSHRASLGGALPKVRVLRRNAARDDLVRAALPADADVTFADLTVEALAVALRGRGEGTLLIQATSAPQRGNDLVGLVPALAAFAGVVADLVYGQPSALYAAARAKGLPAQDGAAMLIEQARLSQMLWWGRAATYEDLMACLKGK